MGLEFRIMLFVTMVPKMKAQLHLQVTQTPRRRKCDWREADRVGRFEVLMEHFKIW